MRALLCEGGPTLHGSLQAAGLADALPDDRAEASGGGAPRTSKASCRGWRPLELAWLLEQGGELFARYRSPT